MGTRRYQYHLSYLPTYGPPNNPPCLERNKTENDALFVNHFLSVVPPQKIISDFRPTIYNTVTRPTSQPPYLPHSTLTIGAPAARNPNFQGSRCTLTGRGCRTHPKWSGQKLQAALLCGFPPKRRSNSHSTPAGRMVYNIYGL